MNGVSQCCFHFRDGLLVSAGAAKSVCSAGFNNRSPASPGAFLVACIRAVLRAVFQVAAVSGDHPDSGVGQFPVQTVGTVSVVTVRRSIGSATKLSANGLLDEGHLVRHCRFRTVTGRPILVPLPRLVLAHPCTHSIFSRGEAPINEGFFKPRASGIGLKRRTLFCWVRPLSHQIRRAL